MNFVKKLSSCFLISLALSISFIRSMQEDVIEAQLTTHYQDECCDEEAELIIANSAKKSYIQLFGANFFETFFGKNTENIISNNEGEKEESKFLFNLLEELPNELLHHIFSFIPIQDVGLSNFLRYIESIKQSRFEFVAEELKNKHHEYRQNQWSKIKLSGTPYESPEDTIESSDLAYSMLSFMSMTKNNDYVWYEGYALNQLIPKYKQIIDFPRYKTLRNATLDYFKDVLLKFNTLKDNGDSKLAYQYIDLHINIIRIFFNRLKAYSEYLIVDTIEFPCCNKCSLGPIDFTEPMNCYSMMFNVGALTSLIAVLWFFTPLPWYYVAATECTGLGCMSLPCFMKKKIDHENEKQGPIHRKINKALHLLIKARRQLYKLRKSMYEEHLESDETCIISIEHH